MIFLESFLKNNSIVLQFEENEQLNHSPIPFGFTNKGLKVHRFGVVAISFVKNCLWLYDSST